MDWERDMTKRVNVGFATGERRKLARKRMEVAIVWMVWVDGWIAGYRKLMFNGMKVGKTGRLG